MLWTYFSFTESYSTHFLALDQDVKIPALLLGWKSLYSCNKIMMMQIYLVFELISFYLFLFEEGMAGRSGIYIYIIFELADMLRLLQFGFSTQKWTSCYNIKVLLQWFESKRAAIWEETQEKFKKGRQSYYQCCAHSWPLKQCFPVRPFLFSNQSLFSFDSASTC